MQHLLDISAIKIVGDGAYLNSNCAIGDCKLPTSIEQLITSRIDQLTAMDGHVLRVASIIGQTFWVCVVGPYISCVS